MVMAMVRSIFMHIVLASSLIKVAVATISKDVEMSPIYVSSQADRCTATALSKGAGANGPMTTHNMDCLNCDFRINKVPAKDWPDGSMRAIPLLRETYPQLVEENRF